MSNFYHKPLSFQGMSSIILICLHQFVLQERNFQAKIIEILLHTLCAHAARRGSKTRPHSRWVYMNNTCEAPRHMCVFYWTLGHREREYVHFWLTQQLRRSSHAACRSGLNHLNAAGKGQEWRGGVWQEERTTPAPRSHSALWHDGADGAATSRCTTGWVVPLLGTRNTHSLCDMKAQCSALLQPVAVSASVLTTHTEKVWRVMQCKWGGKNKGKEWRLR